MAGMSFEDATMATAELAKAPVAPALPRGPDPVIAATAPASALTPVTTAAAAAPTRPSHSHGRGHGHLHQARTQLSAETSKGAADHLSHAHTHHRTAAPTVSAKKPAAPMAAVHTASVAPAANLVQTMKPMIGVGF